MKKSNELLGNHQHGLAFIVSAPAGTGKTTLVKRLIKEFPCIKASVSCTTRKPRPGEHEGRDYHFLTEKQFKDKMMAGDFLEYVQLYECYYGTSRAAALKQLEEGKHVILTIDTQGAEQLKNIFPAVTIFIEPPSLEVLRKRLMSRHTESPERIEDRLEWAKKEMQAANQYDYIIVNDNLDTAYEVLRSIIIAEEHKGTYGKRKFDE